jgi:hypothetical protein
MNLTIGILVLLTAAGCAGHYRQSGPMDRRAAAVRDGIRRVDVAMLEYELKEIVREEGSVAGFERRLEDRGAKIKLGAQAKQRIAMIPISGSHEYYRVIYHVYGARASISRVEMVPAP